jgi:hypothetical protein
MCRCLGIGLGRYLGSIYVRPLATSLPVFALMLACKHSVLPGRGWSDLLAAAAIAGASYYAIAARTCLQPEHRPVFRDVLVKSFAIPERVVRVSTASLRRFGS